MKKTMEIRWASPGTWSAILASLLPLWLFSTAITVEGFPLPPIPIELGIFAFVLAMAVSIFLLWKGWLEVDILLCSLIPFILLFKFDEISTAYKTSFILVCALILSIGLVSAQRSGSVTIRWLILLTVTVATLMLTTNAVRNYWQMASDLGYFECMPDAQGCPPLTGNETPWWVLFFGL